MLLGNVKLGHTNAITVTSTQAKRATGGSEAKEMTERALLSWGNLQTRGPASLGPAEMAVRVVYYNWYYDCHSL
jgi:hypothetical protein